jgi:hypothetical protein
MEQPAGSNPSPVESIEYVELMGLLPLNVPLEFLSIAPVTFGLVNVATPDWSAFPTAIGEMLPKAYDPLAEEFPKGLPV